MLHRKTNSLERILHFPVVERVNDDLGDDVGERDDHKGEEQQYPGVQESVECEGEQDHQAHSQNHCTQLDIAPVDDVEDWTHTHVRTHAHTHTHTESVRHSKMV